MNNGVIRRLYVKPLCRILTVVALLFNIHSASALGVGGASADSYIGQQLSGSIPLFNIQNPDGLQVNILSSTFSASSGPTLSADIDRSNGQLAIKISSDLPVNEPYVSFVIEIVDQSDTINKEFILLLNLAPKGTLTAPQSTPYVAPTPEVVELAGKQVASGELMGPYEWAQAGNIPDRFGAVIDGQSLWRVARRINAAMGVSVEQMMLALYEQNPEAFSTSSVDSLQAGSYLRIPSLELVSRVSNTEAKNELERLSAAQSSASPRVSQTSRAATPVVDSDDVLIQERRGVSEEPPIELQPTLATPTPKQTTNSAEPLEVDSSEQSAATNSVPVNSASSESADTDSFRLMGIDENEAVGSTLVGSRQEKSQEIISSLAATVGNLTQELIQKDKKIEFLEEKITALEALVGVDGSSRVSQSIAQNSANSGSASIASQLAKPVKATSSWNWLWWLLPLLVILSFFFRDRVAGLVRDLNLFGDKEKVDFGRVEPEPEVKVHSEIQDHPVFSAMAESKSNELVMNDLADNGLEFSEIDLSQPPDEETVLELEDPSILEFNESNMDFAQRFERLLDERDFDFALELLNFARHNEIEEDRYHCERLRLLQAMNDEDAFYNYYYDIESSISSFELGIQNRISQLVVDLAQSKAL